MGVLAGRLAFKRYRVVGDNDIQLDDIAAGLQRKAFIQSAIPAEEEIGWVNLGAFESTVKSDGRVFAFPPYAAFSLRIDKRRVPGSLLKEQVEKELGSYLRQHPQMEKVPRKKRAEIKEMAKEALLKKALPVPQTFDVVWDIAKRDLLFTGTAATIVQKFEELFLHSFPGWRLVAVPPYIVAMESLEEEDRAKLQTCNQAGTENLSDLIGANRWLGEEFLLWLLYRSDQERCAYLDDNGSHFTAVLDHRFTLQAISDNDVQKLVATGEQHDFFEVRAGLDSGKSLQSAVMDIESNGKCWQLSLDAVMLDISRLKLPPVCTDDEQEGSGLFYERIMLIEQARAFVNLLFLKFVEQRLKPSWAECEFPAITAWVAGQNQAA